MVRAIGEPSDTYGVGLCMVVLYHVLGKARSHRVRLTKTVSVRVLTEKNGRLQLWGVMHRGES